MKIKNDFALHGSNSFVLARKPEMNERQKAAITAYVERMLLGRRVLTPDSTEAEIQKVFAESYEFEGEKRQQMVRTALKEGKSVYAGWVNFEDCEHKYGKIYEDIWRIMRKNSEHDFTAIDDELAY